MNSLTKTSSCLNCKIDQIEETHSMLCISRDSVSQIGDCQTIASQVQTLEESFSDRNRMEKDLPFRKNELIYNPTLPTQNLIKQKSKFMLLDSSTISQNGLRSDSFESDFLELQAIERKTQDLVAKQRWQRKQLKKLKKLYIQKVQELLNNQKLYKSQKTLLNREIQGLKKQEEELLKQKNAIQAKMKELEREVETTKQLLSHSEQEKHQLYNKIQHLQINYDYHQQRGKKEESILIHQSKVGEPVVQNNSTSNINSQIVVIDKLINQVKEQVGCSVEKYKELVRLLEIKNQYLQQRQTAKVQEERRKNDKIIAKFNDLVVNRDRQIQTKHKIIKQLKQLIHNKETNAGDLQNNESLINKYMTATRDSFFSKGNSTDQSQNFIQGTILAESQIEFGCREQSVNEASILKLKQRIIKIIKENNIHGYEETYQAIEQLTLGILELFHTENCTQEDLVLLIEDKLDSLNNCFVRKAKSNVEKIQKIMTYMKNSDHQIKKKHQEQKYIVHKDSVLNSILRLPKQDLPST